MWHHFATLILQRLEESMKQCDMIYTEEEGKRNQKFIQMFQRAGEAYDLLFSLVPITKYQNRPLPDMVLNRTRDARVSRWYETRQIPVYHDSDVVTMGNDKYAVLQRLQKSLPKSVLDGKWCPGSFLITEEQRNHLAVMERKIRTDFGEAEYVVLKTVDGHGGNEVFRVSADLVSEKYRWQQVLEKLHNRRVICQEWIDSDSRDLRIYILWGKIYAAVLRQGRQDFRSNYSLGGKVCPYSLSKSEQAYIELFVQALGANRLAMAGIDFLITREGALVFNELEEMVGSRMLYQCTSRDIVSDFVGLLKKRM